MNRGLSFMLLWDIERVFKGSIGYIAEKAFVRFYLLRQSICKRYGLYHLRYHTRQQLRYLTPEQLDDIGVSTQQAAVEMAKPFWQE